MFFKPDSTVYEGATTLFKFGPFQIPFEYTGIKEEIIASKTSAWIGTQLMMSPICDIKGPDATKFLNSVCVNDFSTMEGKSIRHAVMCNDKGQILTDGVVLKVAEDTFRTYWLDPILSYYAKRSGMDVEAVNLTGQEYFIQISGEKSLEILERACQCDLHDIKFAKHRLTKIGDVEMRVLRLGMSGNLAYEVHGPIQEFDEVYSKIWEAGQSFGAKKQGMHAYSGPNHTEAGFPNILIHYPMPWMESEPELAQYFMENPMLGSHNMNRRLHGSVGDELQSRFVTPYDLGWGFLVNYNHDFKGKEALEKLVKNPPRTVVTLEWNAEDVGAVFATQFMGKDVEPCERIDKEVDMYYLENMYGGTIYRADKVMSGDQWIGNSTGRIYSYYYNTMISLAFIDPKYAEEGKELKVIWGTPGKPQKEIRVKVARFPYDQMVRNEDRDVEEIPRYSK